MQKKFLLFTTGSDRVPVGGMGEMTFKITKLSHKHKDGDPKARPVNLPEAHTCFNQLVLPGNYTSYEIEKMATNKFFLYYYYYRLQRYRNTKEKIDNCHFKCRRIWIRIKIYFSLYKYQSIRKLKTPQNMFHNLQLYVYI